MNVILRELDRLPLKEIEKKLKRNTYIGPGAIVLSKQSPVDYKRVYIVKARVKNTIFIYTEGMSSPANTSLSEYSPLTFKDYIEYRNQINSTRCPKTVESLERMLTSMLHRLFNPQHVDVKQIDGDEVKFTLYFPTLRITNSLDIEHLMRDVYLSFKVYLRRNSSGYSLSLRTPDLFRTTYTASEWYSNYIYSHLANKPGEIANDWCFGESIVGNLLSRYQGNLPFVQLSSFLLAFISYLQWESIEGVPFRKLTDLKKFTVEKIEESSLDVEPYYKELLKRLPTFDYTYINKDGEATVEILPDSKEEIEILLGKIVEESGNTDLLGITQGSTFGKPIPFRLPSVEEVQSRSRSFRFKGNLTPVQVIQDVEVESKAFLSTMHLHPKVNEIVIQKLQESLLEHIIKYKLGYE